MSSPAPHHPFRVTRRPDASGPPLTGPQQRVLTALVHLCPTSGTDAGTRAVAQAAGLRLGGVVVILQSLVGKRLVTRFDDAEAVYFAPTMTGRARVRHHSGLASHGGRRAVLDGAA